MAGQFLLRASLLAFFLTTSCLSAELNVCENIARVMDCDKTGVAFSRGRQQGQCPFKDGYTCKDLHKLQFFKFSANQQCVCGTSMALVFATPTCAHKGNIYMACHKLPSEVGGAAQLPPLKPMKQEALPEPVLSERAADVTEAGRCQVDRLRVLTRHKLLPTRWMTFNDMKDKVFYDERMKEGLAKEGIHVVSLEAGELPCYPNTCCATRIYIRPQTTDWEVFTQVFRAHMFRDLYPYLPDAKYILDAGGNVGFASVLFALMSPTAQILTVEPDADNARIAAMNTLLHPGVKLLQGGIWSKDTHISVSGSDGQWGFTFTETTEADPNMLPAFSIPSLLAMSAWPRLDLAKIDVEGAEGVVFGKGADTTWLAHVPVLALELHDGLAPRYGIREVSKTVMSVADKYPFTKLFNNEHVYLIREDLIRH